MHTMSPTADGSLVARGGRNVRQAGAQQQPLTVLAVTSDRHYLPGVDKQDREKLDELDRSLNPYGRHLRHLAEHAGIIPARRDEFGRCACCVRHGWWMPDA